MDEEGAEVFDQEDGAPGDLGTWRGVRLEEGDRSEEWHTEIFHLDGYAFVEPDVFNRHVLLVGNVLAITVFCDS